MYRPFRAAVKRHNLIQKGDRLVAGVSGGVDSMVLADLLLNLQTDIPFRLSLAHVNYQMRARESDAQEELVRDFAERNELRFFSTTANLTMNTRWGLSGGEQDLPLTLASVGFTPRERKANFQQAARTFRYHYFAEVAGEAKANKVAVAHTQDDQVETILAQLLRGASVRGLGGMAAERKLGVSLLIRPLLDFSKDQLREYARAKGVLFIDDSSNTSPKYWRNRIRHELLPVLQQLRPKALGKIVRFGGEMSELADFLEGVAKDWLDAYGRIGPDEVWLPRPRWLALPKPLRLEILTQAYTRLKGDARQLKYDHLLRCEQIAVSVKGEGRYPFPGGLKFFRRGDDLLLKTAP